MIIKFGHNDDGDPTAGTARADRSTLPGIGEDTISVTTLANVTETVHSFGWYLRKMIVDVRAVHGIPIISGMVNRNYWTGDVLQSNWPFATYAEQVREESSFVCEAHVAKCSRLQLRQVQSFITTRNTV